MEEKLKAFRGELAKLETALNETILNAKDDNNFYSALHASAQLYELRDIKCRFESKFKDELK